MKQVVMGLLAAMLWLPITAVEGRPAMPQQSIDAAVAALDETEFSGVALVARGDTVLAERAFGQMGPGDTTAITTATRFNLASIGKLFTAMAVLQLAAQGRVDLDAPIGRYLTEGLPAGAETATVEQLLDHTAGLGSYWGPAFDARRSALTRLDAHLPLIAAQSPAFPPGSAWQYSNSGYLLLGLLVERVSGQDYYRYVQERIFAPADMHNSGYYDERGEAAGVAVGRVRQPDGSEHGNEGLRELRGGPAGGGYSTARDLLRFRNALQDGRLLPREWSTRMLSPRAMPAAPAPAAATAPSGSGPVRMQVPAPATRGLGVDAVALGDDVIVGHAGGSRGVAGELRSLRDEGLTVILLSNIDPPRMQPAMRRLYAALAQQGLADFSAGLPTARPGNAANARAPTQAQPRQP